MAINTTMITTLSNGGGIPFTSSRGVFEVRLFKTAQPQTETTSLQVRFSV